MIIEFIGGPHDGLVQKVGYLSQKVLFPAYLMAVPRYVAASFAKLAREQRYVYDYELSHRWNRQKDDVEPCYRYRGLITQ